MAIVVFQHEESESLGRLAPILRDLGHRVQIRRVDLPPGRPGKVGGGIPADFDGVDGVISLGGSMNLTDTPPPAWMDAEMAYLREAHARQLPLLGICLGHQLIAKALGGEVGPGTPEWGFTHVSQTVPGNTDTILAGIPWGSWQLQMHNQQVLKAPEGATILAGSPACKIQAMRIGLRTYGFQYHFESERARFDAAVAGRDKAFAAELAQNGLSASDLSKHLASFYDTFDRLGTRLGNNIAIYMFPLMKKVGRS